MNSTVQCICGYSYFGSIGMVPAHRRSHEDWALFPYMGPLTEPLKQLHLNFGAPGDRRDALKRLWLGYPRSARKARGKIPYAFQVPVKTETAPGMNSFRVNADRIRIGNSELPWVHGSYARGLKKLTVSLVPAESKATERSFTVRLHFCELDNVKPGGRVFDISVQGRTLLKGLDVLKEAGGRYKALVKEFKAVQAAGELTIAFPSSQTELAAANAPILSALEITAEQK